MSTRRFLWRWGLAGSIAAAVVGLVSLPPFVGEPFRTAIMEVFAGLCHQLPGRSPHVHDVSFAVCHRCFGIYTGILTGVLFGPMLGQWRPPVSVGYLLVGALAIPSLDWLGHIMGIWVNTAASRLLTGAALGLILGWIVIRALTQPAAPSSQAAPSKA